MTSQAEPYSCLGGALAPCTQRYYPRVGHGVRPATSVFSVLPAQRDTLALFLPPILIIVAGH
jgi:hypothetical protein